MASNYDWANLTEMGRQMALATGAKPTDGFMTSAGSGAVPGYYDNNVGPMTSGGQYTFAKQNLTNWSPPQIQNNASAETGYDAYSSPWSRFADSTGNPLAAYHDGTGYRVFNDPGDFGGTGFAGQKLGKMVGTNYDLYDNTGNFLNKGTFSANEGWKDENMGDALGVASILAMAGGAAAAGLGSGAGAGATAGGLSSDIGTMYAGADAGAAASLGGGGSMAAGAAGAVPAVGGAVGGAGGAASAGLGSINIPGLGNMSIQQLGSLASTIGKLTGGGGGGGQTGGGIGGLGDLINLGAGAYGAQQQGNAANEMKAWLQSQQAKIDNQYNPGTPEYNALWDEMSRKDAAAGRNSQYGPRSVDLAARITGIKADATNRFTAGTSRAYADALNQNASKYAGLTGALGQAVGPNSGGGLLSLLGGMGGGTNLGGGIGMTPSGGITGVGNDGWTGGTLTNEQIDEMINGGGYADPYAIFW